jgi:hypothetical protein
MSGARPDDLIEVYVGDVVKRLPGRQRSDVGFELRALLGEELRGRAEDAGRSPDEAMTLELLRGFGHPEEAAMRYHPPGPPIIPPQHGRAFAWATFIGVALQWAVSLPLYAGSGVYNWVGAWWTSYGLGAFWWPGFLVSVMMVAAFVRRRWPAQANVWTPRAFDRDHVNRPLFMVGLGFALAGVGLWVLLAWWSVTNQGANAMAKVFEFDAGFLAMRAPVVLVYWGLAIALLVVVIVEGRWRALTRRLDTGLKLACAAMLAWIIAAGPVFVQASTDAPTRGALGLLAAVLLVQAGWRLWRRRMRAPEAARGV